MKKFTLLFFLLLFGMSFVNAQRTVTGNITDTDGMALIGANVLVKGTVSGTVTDFDGNFSLEVPADHEVLEISYTGFATQEVNIANQSNVVIQMLEGEVLSEVVVTALGITKEKKSLGYSTQEVQGEELNRSVTNNFVNNLSGRVSGVQIRANNNFGGSTNVVIRGNSSLTSDNQALFVIDGVAVNNANTNTQDQRRGSTGYDYGNAASDINPNDIESINVLKGAAATALYGSRAANGAVIITTKKGKKGEGLGISINSNITVGKIDKSTMLSYQDKYGAGYGPYYGSTGYFEDVDVDGDGVDDLVVPTYDDASYGAAFDPNLNVYQWESFIPESSKFGQAYPYVAAKTTPVDFFETETTLRNSIAISSGNDLGSFRLGFTNLNSTGILPNSELKKNTLNFSSSYNLSDKLTANLNGTYIDQGTVGRNSTGYSDNIMSSFRQWWQVNVDVNALRDLYDQTGRNVTWNSNAPWAGDFSPLYWDNPYWTRYKNFQSDNRNRIIGSASLDYKLNDWLSVLGRVSVDNYSDLREERREIGSTAAPFGVTPSGVNAISEGSGYQRMDIQFNERNYDLLLTADKYLNDDLSLKALLGTNIRRSSDERVRASTSGGLVVPGLFALSNSVGALPLPNEQLFEKQVNGYFAGLTLGYKNFLYFDVTDRVDISSTLPVDNNTYNYYSGSVGLIFSELMDQSWLNFGKLRVSYAQVGNDAPALAVNDTYSKIDNFGESLLFSVPGTQNNVDLKPERTKSFEAGVEVNVLNNRLGFDIAYYNNRTQDQILPVSVSRATGANFKYVNAGEVENKGVELSITGKVIRQRNFRWTVGLNYTRNRNKVLSLFEGVDNLQLRSYQGGITLNATVGQPYGTLRGTGFQFDNNGNKVINSTGSYVAVADQIIGNANPDWIGGLSNSIKIGAVALNFLIDVQKGGDLYSLDLHYGQGTGLPDYTAGLNELGNPVRDPVADGGGILFEGVQADGTVNTVRRPADNFGGAYYWGNATRNPGAMTIYDASYVKLREVGLTYSLPNNIFSNSFINGAEISITGRNLWIIHKNLPFADPESGLSSGNDQGYISGAYPTTRTIGVDLKFDF